jgi:hypothetical protein
MFKPYIGELPYCFVSYAHADSEVVYPIIRELHDRGVLLWYDEGIDAGAEWQEFIADRILHCEKFLLFISPNSVKSHHVGQEINYANGKRKPIMPVFLKQTKLNAGIEMTISTFQALFYYAFKNDSEKFFSQLVTSLTQGFIDAGAELTELEAEGSHHAILRLDETGDVTLPAVIHLPRKGRFSIGRFDISVGVKQSDFEFSKETKNISRKHAFIDCADDEYKITDLGSQAGTWLDGAKIPPQTPTTLTPGCRVSFGNGGARYIFAN